MHLLDLLVLLILAIAAFNGWLKGFVGKFFSLAGLVGGIWLALRYGASCGHALHMEGTTAAAVGFLIVFVAAAAAANLVGRFAGKAFGSIGLGGLDSLLGIALALLQAVLLLGLAFKAVDYFAPTFIGASTREESKCYGPLMRTADKVFPALEEYARRYLPRTNTEEGEQKPAQRPASGENLRDA